VSRFFSISISEMTIRTNSQRAGLPLMAYPVGEKTIRHRLATGYAHQLPEGHPLLE
jgi:hypothetical protein